MRQNVEHAVHQCQCVVCQTDTDTDLSQRHQQMNLFLSRLSEPQRRWYVGMLSRDPHEPTGSFSAVAAGEDHSCAMASNGTLACWGDNSSGATTPPVPPTFDFPNIIHASVGVP